MRAASVSMSSRRGRGRLRLPTRAMVIRITASSPTFANGALMEANTGSRSVDRTSMMPKAAMLKMLLPNRLPTAMSYAPIRAAATLETSSGSEVAMATNRAPTNPVLIPVTSAISMALSTIRGLMATSTAAQMAKPTMACFRPGIPARSSAVDRSSAGGALLSWIIQPPTM